MKEGSEGEPLQPLSLSKKETGSNANNQTTSPVLVPPSLASTPPYLTSATRGHHQVVGATLAVIGAEVAAAAVAAAAAAAAAAAHSPNSKVDNNNGNGGGKLARGVVVPKDTAPPNSARDKIFVCSVCNRCFGYKHVLQNHERTHTGEKPFECKECHKRFTRDHHLKTHMRLHTGEKPYHCTHCERQFVQVANLRRHLRVHTGERPYACELCTSRFSDSNQLKAHMLIHKGEKPFECKQCLGRFRRRHHLMHHKCPNEDSNLGKPRRGRRPKTADDLERGSPEQLPTMVPVDRPKRERKPRETRRIIKVSIPPIMTLGEGSRYAMASPFAARPPPPISPPEQTEPEDLSMHGTDNGDRARMPQQPPRPSSVPISLVGGCVGQQPLTLRAKTPPGRGGNHDDRDGHRLRSRLMMTSVEGHDDGGSESEAMVEEEEEDEDEEDDEEDHMITARHRMRGIRGPMDDEDDLEEDMDEDEELMSEGIVEGEDDLGEDLGDELSGPGRLIESGSEAENGGNSLSPHPVKSRSRQQQQQHPHHPHPHYPPPSHHHHHHHPLLQHRHHIQHHPSLQHNRHHPHHPPPPGVPLSLTPQPRSVVVSSTGAIIPQGPNPTSPLSSVSLQSMTSKMAVSLRDELNGDDH